MAGQMPVVVISGGEFAVVLCNRPRQVARTALLPPSLVVSALLRCRLRCPARGVYPAAQTAHLQEGVVEVYQRVFLSR